MLVHRERRRRVPVQAGEKTGALTADLDDRARVRGQDPDAPVDGGDIAEGRKPGTDLRKPVSRAAGEDHRKAAGLWVRLQQLAKQQPDRPSRVPVVRRGFEPHWPALL